MPHGAANGVAGFPARVLHAKGPSKIRAQGSLTSRGCSRNTFPGCRGPATGRRDPLLLRHVPRIRGIPHRQLLHLWKGYVPRTQGIPCSTSSSPKSRRVCSPDNDARRVSATGIFPGYGGFPDQLGDLSDGISYLPRIYPAVSVLCRGRLRTFPNPGPVLCGGVRGADTGDGRHPPDRHGHQPHPRRADRLNRNAGLYVVGRHPRRNPHRRRAVRHHRHRGYALRLSRHRPPRRVRRHDVDPLLQPAL